MYPTKILHGIYREHGYNVPRMVETLLEMGVPTEDAGLLGQLPWKFSANRIVVEREHLGLGAVRRTGFVKTVYFWTDLVERQRFACLHARRRLFNESLDMVAREQNGLASHRPLFQLKSVQSSES